MTPEDVTLECLSIYNDVCYQLEVTSLPSTDLAALLSRITELDIEQDADVPRNC